MKTNRVFLTNPIHPEASALLARHAEVQVASASDPQTLLHEGRLAHYIVVRAPLPEALLENGAFLKGVVRHGAGLDMIPLGAAERLGLAVANVPGVNAVSVAEHVIGQMLNLARRLPAMDRALRQQSWSTSRQLADGGSDLAGKTLTIVGVGAIGQRLARMATAGFDMTVLGVRRTPSADSESVSYVSLAEALPRTDYLVLACPLTDETRGLIGAAALKRLKPGARLVNVSRGPVIETQAVVAALRDGSLAGAALDVFDTQPLPADAEWHTTPETLLSPHAASLTVESMRRMSDGAAEQVLAMIQGRLPRHLVNDHITQRIHARWAAVDAL